jgi:hypothetical protein
LLALPSGETNSGSIRSVIHALPPAQLQHPNVTPYLLHADVPHVTTPCHTFEHMVCLH